MEIIKKNITFILGISIPVLMILIVAGSVYLPGFFVKAPAVNFLYSVNDDNYYCNGVQQYIVQDSQLVRNTVNQPEVKDVALACNNPKIFIQDVVRNESRQISFEEAQKLNLDFDNISSDGFEVVYGNRGDNYFPLFFYTSPDYSARYLKGHGISKKLNIQLKSSYSYGFHFLGWIK